MARNNAWNSCEPACVPNGGTGVSTITGVITGNGTSPFTASTVSQYGVVVGDVSNLLQSVAPSATVGLPLISQGASANPTYGTISVPGGGTGAATLTGIVIGHGTSAMTGNAVTQHDVLVGGASNAVTSVAPSGTSGVPLISQGASSDPAFGTAVVAGGGTGITTTTAYGVITGGTTATGAFQNAGTGTSGQVLKSNGAGSLPTWVNDSVGMFSVVRQVFTTSGTYTPTAGMVYCNVEICGGGGGGGGTPAVPGGYAAVSGNGGGAGYCSKVFGSATIGVSQIVTIGAAGSGGAIGATPGNTGGTTTFGAFLSATGGTGGAAGFLNNSTSVAVATGGLGGSASGGDYNVNGGGGGEQLIYANQPACQSPSGNSFFGGGVIRTYPSGAGTTPQTYGVGGSGGSSAVGGSARAGAAGAPGICIVTEYVFS